MLKSIISVTPSAAIKLLDIQKKYQAKYINFTIKSGGCSGFQYVLEPCHQELVNEDLYEKENLKIKIHKEDTFQLLGTEIDWEDDIMGQRFIFNNPNSSFQCGCGKSFN
jgi:iron-sulfur cluster assembly protein